MIFLFHSLNINSNLNRNNEQTFIGSLDVLGRPPEYKEDQGLDELGSQFNSEGHCKVLEAAKTGGELLVNIQVTRSAVQKQLSAPEVILRVIEPRERRHAAKTAFEGAFVKAQPRLIR